VPAGFDLGWSASLTSEIFTTFRLSQWPIRLGQWPLRDGTHSRVMGGSCPAQNRDDLVATACDGPSRDGAAPFVRREIVMGNRGPRRTLIRIYAVRRCRRPANAPIAGPASAKSHRPRKAPRPVRCVAPARGGRRASESALPSGTFRRRHTRTAVPATSWELGMEPQPTIVPAPVPGTFSRDCR
jgi:hypothetical protein